MSQLRRLLQSLIVVGLVFGLSGFANAQSTSTNVLTQQNKRKKKKKRKKVVKKKVVKKKVVKKTVVRRPPVNLAEVSMVNKVLKNGAAGLEIGFAMGNLTCDCSGEVPEYDGETGFFGAARYEKSMSPLLGYAAEAAFVQKGASLDQPGDDLENTLSYIQASLQMRLRFTATRLTSIYLGAGPFVSILTGAEVKVGNSKNRAEEKKFNTLDAGLGVSAGAYFGLSNRMRMLGTAGIAYYHGLMNVKDDLPDNDDRLKTSVFLITAGILFAGG